MESSKSTISKINEWTALQTFLVFVTLSTLSNPLKEFIKERCTVAPILLIIINNTKGSHQSRKKKCDKCHTFGFDPLPPNECDNSQPIFFKLLAS